PGADNNNGGEDTGGGNAGGDTGGQEDRQCVNGGKEVACTTKYGTWDGECYVKAADPQPPKSDPVWGDHTDGVIVARTCGSFDSNGILRSSTIVTVSTWAPSAPGDAGPSPAELAHRAVAQMNLDMGRIGATPTPLEQDPDSLGAVGTPIWLWVDNPAPNTTG